MKIVIPFPLLLNYDHEKKVYDVFLLSHKKEQFNKNTELGTTSNTLNEIKQKAKAAITISLMRIIMK